jgi:two-component sensor histidine kinase
MSKSQSENVEFESGDVSVAQRFYQQHRDGVLVRSGASLLMWITAIPAYQVGLLGATQFRGVCYAVVFLVVLNFPLLWLAGRLREKSSFEILSIAVHGCEILGYTAIIHFSGGLEATFLALIYCGLVAYIGVVAPRRHLFFVAGMSAAAFCGLVMLEHLGFLPSYPLYSRFPVGSFPWPIVSVILAIVTGLILVVAIITARTSDLLRKNRASLRLQRDELEREIGARKESEEQLRLLVDEKQMLLKEVHHRVKNNLQVISSLLKLQAESIPDTETRTALLASQGRVSSMAMVHEMFYQSGDLQRVDLAPFLRNLAAYLRSAYDLETRSVEVRVDTDTVRVNLDTAIRVGLVVNELVTNALKHAFPGHDTPGLLEISMDIESDSAELVVADNGCGLPESVDWDSTNTLGLQLVKNLARQLCGTIRLETANGTAFHLRFPLQPKVETPTAQDVS